MEYIILPVFPIWEGFCICALSYDGFLLGISSLYYFFFWLHLEVFICVVASGASIHLMRVDNFGFFFQVKCFSLFEYNCISQLLLEVLLVARTHALWVWVPDKFVCAPCFTASLVSCQSSWVNICTIFLNALASLGVVSVPRKIDVSLIRKNLLSVGLLILSSGLWFFVKLALDLLIVTANKQKY